MDAFWTVIALVFTIAVLLTLAFSAWYALSRRETKHISEAPTVDGGWRGWH